MSRSTSDIEAFCLQERPRLTWTVSLDGSTDLACHKVQNFKIEQFGFSSVSMSQSKLQLRTVHWLVLRHSHKELVEVRVVAFATSQSWYPTQNAVELYCVEFF